MRRGVPRHEAARLFPAVDGVHRRRRAEPLAGGARDEREEARRDPPRHGPHHRGEARAGHPRAPAQERLGAARPARGQLRAARLGAGARVDARALVRAVPGGDGRLRAAGADRSPRRRAGDARAAAREARPRRARPRRGLRARRQRAARGGAPVGAGDAGRARGAVRPRARARADAVRGAAALRRARAGERRGERRARGAGARHRALRHAPGAAAVRGAEDAGAPRAL